VFPSLAKPGFVPGQFDEAVGYIPLRRFLFGGVIVPSGLGGEQSAICPFIFSCSQYPSTAALKFVTIVGSEAPYSSSTRSTRGISL
jgi:hypothetical protein